RRSARRALRPWRSFRRNPSQGRDSASMISLAFCGTRPCQEGCKKCSLNQPRDSWTRRRFGVRAVGSAHESCKPCESFQEGEAAEGELSSRERRLFQARLAEDRPV